MIPFGFRKYNIKMYFICICKHHTREKKVPTYELQKELYNPPERDLDALTTPKKNTTRQVNNITVYCSPQWTYGLSVLILYILRVADLL